MKSYFLKIWEGDKLKEIKHYQNLMDCWKCIVQEHIQFYSVYEADIVLDQSG